MPLDGKLLLSNKISLNDLSIQSRILSGISLLYVERNLRNIESTAVNNSLDVSRCTADSDIRFTKLRFMSGERALYSHRVIYSSGINEEVLFGK